MSVESMSTASADTVLGKRLERLTGAEASCCLPEYQALARTIRRSGRFERALEKFQALADTHRLLALLLLQRKGELCACEIQAATGLTHATVSHHMRVLERAGLVDGRRQGKWMYYRLNRSSAEWLP